MMAIFEYLCSNMNIGFLELVIIGVIYKYISFHSLNGRRGVSHVRLRILDALRLLERNAPVVGFWWLSEVM